MRPSFLKKISNLGGRTLLVAFGVAALVAVTGQFAYGLYTSRQQALDTAAQTTERLTWALADRTSIGFAAIDTALLATVAHLETLQTTGLTPGPDLKAALRSGVRALPFLRRLSLIDEAGRVVETSQDEPAPNVSVADRDYFKAQIERDAGLFIGAVARSRVDGRSFISLSRRLVHPDGRFAGVLAAVVDAAEFQASYGALQVGPGGSVTVIRADGIIFFRHPHNEDFIGRSLAGESFFREHLGVRPSGTFRTVVTATDSVDRITSYRRLEQFPLVVGVGVAVDDALANWYRDAVELAWAWVAMTVTLGIFLALLLVEGQRQKRANSLVRQSEARYRLLAENATDLIERRDLNGKRLYVSPSAREVLGYTPEEMLASPPFSLVHPDDASMLRSAFGELVSRGGRRAARCRIRHKDGRWVWVETAGRVVRDPDTGTPVEVVCVARDITGQVAFEEQLAIARREAEAASRAKSDFLATMSHELRTPLNAVIGFSELLLSTPLNAEQQRYVLYQRDAGRGLLLLIGDILDFSKIEAGQLDLDETDFDTRHLVEGCRALVAHAAESKGLTVTARVDEDVPAILRGDAMRIRQIALNFLSNAVKFTDSGSVSVIVTRLPGGVGVRLAVSDTGRGIPASRLGDLFHDFSQVERTGTKGEGGTGLGLAISRRLAERMGGSVGVTSVQGAGSTFWADLPLSEGAPDRVVRKVKTGTAPEQALRILLAEDVEPNRLLATRVLEQAGHTVVAVANGQDAVAAAAQGGFDVLVLDVQMPVLDGVEAARRIRALGHGPGEVPILALTANALASEVERCRAAGMDGHMAKPFEPSALVARVHELARKDGVRMAAAPPAPGVANGRFDELRELLGEEGLLDFIHTSAEGLLRQAMVLDAASVLEDVRLAAHAVVSLAGGAGLNALLARARALMNHPGEDWAEEAQALAEDARQGAEIILARMSAPVPS
ncbi:MAG TPA: ATP-binding protein [Azospirillaceae bacterium]|nr:ATP-binding protein [Azospirillaceae bacterium]